MSVEVRIERVSHRYGAGLPWTLEDVSLDVAAGDLLTVLGPSGSGKSTLLALVAGLESPGSGAIRFDGADIGHVPAALRGAALVLQQPYLFPYMTVGENVAFGLAARGVARRPRRAEAERWLDLVGLDGMSSRRPGELSGGEQQRVALVRALAIEPRVLLLDEPLASLDARVRESLQGVLRSVVAETGVTTLMVTHDLSEAMALGDRTALLCDGRLIAEGAPGELYRRPPTRTAAELVGVSTFIVGTPRGAGIETSGGVLALSEPPRPGVRLCAGIRPEHVTAEAGRAAGPNRVPGTVASAIFRGEHWEVRVDSALGELRARCASRLDPGARCTVTLPPEHLFPLDDPVEEA